MIQTIDSQEQYVKAYQTFDMQMRALREHHFETLSALYTFLRAQQKMEPFSFLFDHWGGIRLEDALECVEYHYWNA